MALDQDIAAATTQLDLDKIKAQDYRKSLQVKADSSAAELKAVETHTAWAKEEALKITDPVPMTFKEEMALVLAAKYFTTGTAEGTNAETDAIKDAARFKYALREALKAVSET